LDLFIEFRNRTNGLKVPAGSGLLGALTYFGIPTQGSQTKDEMRSLALRGGPWSLDEQRQLVQYCEADVVDLERLLEVTDSDLDPRRALQRGSYRKAVARMERGGVPVEADRLDHLRRAWREIQDDLIQQVDHRYGVFDGRAFKRERFEVYLQTHGIPWPRLE